MKTHSRPVGRFTALAVLLASLAAGKLDPAAAAASAAQPPIRVLILSGQNNHDWRQTTPNSGKVTLPANAGLDSAEALLLKALARYHFGMSRQPILDLEKCVAAVSSDGVERETLAGKLAEVPGPAALAAVKACLDDPALGPEAKAALQRLQEREAKK
jgi:hypothetical protein